MDEIIDESLAASNNYSCFNQTELSERHKFTAWVTIVACCLSILGSSLIVLSYVLYKDVRKSTARAIVFCLAITDLLSATGYIIAPILFYSRLSTVSKNVTTNTSLENVACKVQSFWTTWLVLSSFFWTSYLALYFVLILVFKKSHWSRVMMAVFLLTAWTVPLLICTAAIATKWLGPSTYSTIGPWCWISTETLLNKTAAQAERVTDIYFTMQAVAGKFWEILTFVIVLVCILIIVLCNRCKWQKVINRSVKPGSYSSEIITGAYGHRNFELRLILIPVIFIVFRSFGMIRYLISLLPNCHKVVYQNNKAVSLCITNECSAVYSPALMAAQALFDPLQGFGNAVLFVFTSKVILLRFMLSIKKVLQKCLCHRTRSRNNEGESVNYTSDQNHAEGADDDERKPLVRISFPSKHNLKHTDCSDSTMTAEHQNINS